MLFQYAWLTAIWRSPLKDLGCDALVAAGCSSKLKESVAEARAAAICNG